MRFQLFIYTVVIMHNPQVIPQYDYDDINHCSRFIFQSAHKPTYTEKS